MTVTATDVFPISSTEWLGCENWRTPEWTYVIDTAFEPVFEFPARSVTTFGRRPPAPPPAVMPLTVTVKFVWSPVSVTKAEVPGAVVPVRSLAIASNPTTGSLNATSSTPTGRRPVPLGRVLADGDARGLVVERNRVVGTGRGQVVVAGQVLGRPTGMDAITVPEDVMPVTVTTKELAGTSAATEARAPPAVPERRCPRR